MSASPAIQHPRTRTVQQDWIAWLPDQSEQLFAQLRDNLGVSCMLLRVVLNDALDASSDAGASDLSPQLALLFAALFDRMVGHLGSVLTALEEHGGACDTKPNAVPLRPQNFRSRRARYLARANQLHSFLSIADRSAFKPKLGAIRLVMASLQHQVHNETREVITGESRCARNHWERLEVLQYDLNTCLQETTVALKSFFCVLPSSEVPLFRHRLPV